MKLKELIVSLQELEGLHGGNVEVMFEDWPNLPLPTCFPIKRKPIMGYYYMTSQDFSPKKRLGGRKIIRIN